MKHLLTTAFVSLAGTALLPLKADAATLTYNPDDLLLGFRATSGTGAQLDYLVNLGQASQFLNATGTITLSIGNISADLVAVFGANWNTRSDVLWSVSGATTTLSAVGSDPARTLYATKPELTVGTLESPWLRGSSSGQGPVANQIQSMGQGFAFTAGTPNQSTANSTFALIQQTTDVNSYSFFQGDSSSFGYFNPSIEGNFGSGTSGTRLDLVRLLPGSAGTPGNTIGTFSINDSGTLTYTAVVPEPSTSLALVLGGAALLSQRRRKSAGALSLQSA